MTTVDRIFQLIKENNMTAKEFASIVGLSAGNITDWKTGRAKPSVASLEKIQTYFNVSVDWLIGKSSKKKYIDYIYLEIPEDFISKYCINLSEYWIEFIKRISFYLLVENISSTEVLDEIYSELELYKVPNTKHKQLEDAILFLYDYNKQFDLLEKIEKKDTPKFFSVPIVGKIAAGQPILAEEYLEGYLPVDPNIYGLSASDDLFYLRVSGQSMNMRVKNGDYALIHKQEYAENGDIVVAIVNGDDEATLKKYKKLNEQFVLLEPMSTDPTIEPITIDLKNTKFQIIGKAIGHFGKF